MADDETQATGETEEKSKKKLFMIIGGVVVLGVVYFMFFKGGAEVDPTAATTTTAAVEGLVIEADEMTVSLVEESRYARIRYAVVLPENQDSGLVGMRMPVLKAAILAVMSGYSADDLRGPAAIETLRDQFTSEALDVWTEGEVLRVVVTEVVIQ